MSDLYLLNYFRVSKSTAKSCENLKALFSSFSNYKQPRQPAGFQFPFNQGGESQRAEQGVVKYVTTPCRPGAEALCASGSGMIWHETPATLPSVKTQHNMNMAQVSEGDGMGALELRFTTNKNQGVVDYTMSCIGSTSGSRTTP